MQTSINLTDGQKSLDLTKRTGNKHVKHAATLKWQGIVEASTSQILKLVLALLYVLLDKYLISIWNQAVRSVNHLQAPLMCNLWDNDFCRL